MEGYLKDGTFYKQTRVINELCSDTGEAYKLARHGVCHSTIFRPEMAFY